MQYVVNQQLKDLLIFQGTITATDWIYRSTEFEFPRDIRKSNSYTRFGHMSCGDSVGLGTRLIQCLNI